MNILFHDRDTRRVINKLINFFGTENIECFVDHYKKSLACSGFLSSEYYFKKRHPWGEALTIFLERERLARSQTIDIPLSIRRLTRDAVLIAELQRAMPSKIKEKFRIDLLDHENASAYLFELHIGWHFHKSGYEIIWYTEDNQPEFCVKTPTFSFDVECKRISFDASRKIRRKDFYRFAELLLPRIKQLNLQGTVEIVLEGRLHGSDENINGICTEVLDSIKSDNLQGDFKFSQGAYFLNLNAKNKTQVDIYAELNEIHEKHENTAHATGLADNYLDSPVDPLFLILRSQKKNPILEGIKKKIQDAAKRQLKPDRPGLIACFLETIRSRDISKLADDSGLQIMSNEVFMKDQNKHLIALAFCGEEGYVPGEVTEKVESPVVSFNNPNCILEEGKNFCFFPLNR